MVRNPIEKFQEFWRTLAPEDQGDLYFVLSAIRGPDLRENFSLKEQYTIPIRKLLFDNHFGQTLRPMGVESPDHFIAHAQMAESILKHHGFKKDETDLQNGTRIPSRGWANTNQQTLERQAVVPLPRISIAGSEAEIAVHLRLVAARERRDPFHS